VAGGYLWYHAIQPYMRNYQILYCPDQKHMGPDYGMNVLCSGLDTARAYDASTIVLTADVSPELLCAHANWPGGQTDPAEWWANDVGNDLCQAVNDNSYAGNGQRPPHNDGVVYGFLDGHAKWDREERVDTVYHWNPLAVPPQ